MAFTDSNAFSITISDLPSWVPPPGQIAAISLNTIESVNPCSSGQSGCPWSGTGQRDILDSWNGGAFAPWLGAMGSWLIGAAGGHSSYYGNEVYRYDVATRMWSRLSNPTNPMNFNQTFGEVAPGVPAVRHIYNNIWAIPGSAYGNVNGALVLTVAASLQDGGSESYSGQSHAFNLDTNTWSRLSTNRAQMAGDTGGTFLNECCTLYDPGNGTRAPGFYRFTQHFNRVQRLPASGGAWTDVTTQNGFMSLDTVADFCPPHDIGVFVEVDGGLHSPRTAYFDPDNPQPPGTLNDTGTRPGQGCGFSWSPLLGKFGAWNSGNVIRYLTPPASNPFSAQWVWTSETLGGTTPQTPISPNPPYNKFQWCPAIKCFITVTRYNGPVYAFRPSAAV